MDNRSFDDILKQLRAPFPPEAIEYQDPDKRKNPFISHEWFRKRLLEVHPEEVEFTIHDVKIETFMKNHVATHVVVAHCSLRINGWVQSALGTHTIKFLKDNDNVPVDLGGAYKSATTNAFVNCCKAFYMGTEQLLQAKGERVPGPTLDLSSSQRTTPTNASNTAEADPLVGDECVKCHSPRRQSDVEACIQANAGHIAYCKNCIPAHFRKRAKR